MSRRRRWDDHFPRPPSACGDDFGLSGTLVSQIGVVELGSFVIHIDGVLTDSTPRASVEYRPANTHRFIGGWLFEKRKESALLRHFSGSKIVLEDLPAEHILRTGPFGRTVGGHFARLSIVGNQLNPADVLELIRIENRQMRHRLRPGRDQAFVELLGDLFRPSDRSDRHGDGRAG